MKKRNAIVSYILFTMLCIITVFIMASLFSCTSNSIKEDIDEVSESKRNTDQEKNEESEQVEENQKNSYRFVRENDEESYYTDKLVFADDGYVYVQNMFYKELTKLNKTWERKDYMILIKEENSCEHSEIYFISNDSKMLIKFINNSLTVYILEE